MTLKLFKKDHKYQEWISALSINLDGLRFQSCYPVQVISCCFLVSVSNILILCWVNHLLNTVSRWFGFAVVISTAPRDCTFQRSEGSPSTDIMQEKDTEIHQQLYQHAFICTYSDLNIRAFWSTWHAPWSLKCLRLRKQVKIIFVKEAPRIRGKKAPYTNGWSTIKRNWVG